MNQKEFRKMLDLMAESWTNCDYETVADKFAEKIFYSDGLNYSFTNRTDLLEFFKDDGGFSQSCAFHTAVFDETTQIGAGEYTYQGTFCYHGTVWIKIKDGKIIEWREYQHVSEKNYSEFWKTV